MKVTPTRADANRLLLEGAQVLSVAERTGIRVDMDHCNRMQVRLDRRCARLEELVLGETPLGRTWQESFAGKTTLQSDSQLTKVLRKMGIAPGDKKTAKGRDSMRADVLEKLGVEGIRELGLLRKLRKARTTYLEGTCREAVQHADGLWYVHPFFHLNTVRTFRSSSSALNLQNIPTRDPEIKKIIRPIFRPRPGRILMEMDFSALEVGTAACAHQDPAMLRYLRADPGAMHSDMARELFRMPPGAPVEKPVRHAAKNGFVFPEFYGDWYRDCAQSIWELRNKLDINGITLRDQLRQNGIRSYALFEEHVKDIERQMWDERFPVYRDWKERWWREYLQRGYFDTMTGFRCSGEMRRNEVINYPVQGSAFHCLLQTLIWAVRAMERRFPEVLLVGQIHDSGLFDLPEALAEEWHRVFARLVRTRLPAFWSWIIVPMDVEAERSEVDGSWYAMRNMKETA